MREKKTTIKDVAQRAGVAISTVSRVMNSLDRVSKQTRKAVWEAVEALDYKPNILAKSLKAKKSQAIGFICEDISSPFLSQVLRGVEQRASGDQYSTIICSSQWQQENTLRHLDLLMDRSIDGIIYSTPMRIHEPLLSRLKELRERVPLVLLSDDNLDDGFLRINVDIHQGMKEILDYLFSLGHRNISMIAGPENSGINALKIEVYKNYMKNAGLAEFLRYVYTDFSIKQGEKAAGELLDNNPPPTAVIGVADLSVIGGLQEAKSRGLNVPRDISFVGWGGIEYGNYTDPPITTAVVPRYQMGWEAASLLLASRENSGDFLQDQKLEVNLAVRGSSAGVSSGGGG